MSFMGMGGGGGGGAGAAGAASAPATVGASLSSLSTSSSSSASSTSTIGGHGAGTRTQPPPPTQYRIQIFPHREVSGANPLAGAAAAAPAGFNFAPIEKTLVQGTVIRIGRKVDRQQRPSITNTSTTPGPQQPVTSPAAGARSGPFRWATDAPGVANSTSLPNHNTTGSVVAESTVVSPQDAEHIQNALANNGTDSSGAANVSPYAARALPREPSLPLSLTLVPREPSLPLSLTLVRNQEPEMPLYLTAHRNASSSTDRSIQGNGVASSTSNTPTPIATTAVNSSPPSESQVPKTDFIAFRSKVVSRTHAELWIGDDGQVLFRDVGSSSGTFLNRMRLSPSGRESRPYVIKSGDLIHLGVDYQGRQEEIYKCVQMKIFVSVKSKERPKTNPARLRVALKALLAAMNPTGSNAADAACTECCICLGSLSPQQAMFLAPCSHCFHYRCVMPLLGSNIMFQCPLCRQVANLDASVMDEEGGGEDSSNYSDGGEGVEEWVRSILPSAVPSSGSASTAAAAAAAGADGEAGSASSSNSSADSSASEASLPPADGGSPSLPVTDAFPPTASPKEWKKMGFFSSK